MSEQKILNYIQGKWVEPHASDFLPVANPATQELLGSTPLSLADDVDFAAQAAQSAFMSWRRTPPNERIQYLFRLKYMLDEHIEEIARLITMECGKTFEESKAEMRRISRRTS